jgi:hypothetical protein
LHSRLDTPIMFARKSLNNASKTRKKNIPLDFIHHNSRNQIKEFVGFYISSTFLRW